MPKKPEPQAAPAAILDPKTALSDKVIRIGSRREQKEYATKPIMLLSLQETAESLLMSSVVREWLHARIIEKLQRGESFLIEDLCEYRLATQQEVIDAASQGLRVKTIKEWAAPDPTQTVADASRPGRAPKAPSVRKAARQDTAFTFTIPPAGKARDKAFAELTTQGRQLLEIVVETGQERLNVAALEAVLDAGRASKGIDPKIPLLQRFKRFHTTGAYKNLVNKEG
jgi:hypothetical protein